MSPSYRDPAELDHAGAPPSSGSSAWQGEEEQAAVNPLDLIRDRLEGRWVQAIVTALIVATIGATVAWFIAPVRYTGEAWLKGNAENDIIVERINETGDTQSFNTYLEAQAMLLASPTVVQHALQSPALQPLVQEHGYDSMLLVLQMFLSANVQESAQLITVRFSDPNPVICATVANAVATAYMDLHGSNNRDRLESKKTQLRQFKSQNRTTAETKRNQQQQLLRSSRYGIADIGKFIEQNVIAMISMEDQVKLINVTLKSLEDDAREQGEEITGDEIPEPTLPALEVFDPKLVMLKSDIEGVKIQLDQLKARFAPDHRQVRILATTITSMEKNYDQRVNETRLRWLDGPGKEQSYQRLLERKARSTDLITDKRAEIDDMNSMRAQFEARQDGIRDLDAEWSLLDDRLRSIEFEQDALKDPITIVQLAEPPRRPLSDKRGQMALAAAGGGFVGVFGLFFLLGSIDQRTFAIRQLQSDKSNFNCLGVVPTTIPGDSNSESLEMAMNCVHRLRNRIESSRTHTDSGFVMLVSSPFQGDGKTTVATLLASSYSESGFKTCMIDCDFIGRSLSHQFRMLKEPGLKEALTGADLSSVTLNINGRENLFMIPMGINEAINAENMSLDAAKQILVSLREQFDIVIIDTGPLSGSVESTPLANAVDGVMLTLRKGRSRVPLRRCVEELRALGAPYFGVVLNYADRSDYRNFSDTSKSINDLLLEEAAGHRVNNPLTEQIAGRVHSSSAHE